MGEGLLRFVLGGAIVSLFAAFGEVAKPKTFAGMFGAAPSLGLATIGITFVRDGSGVVGVEGRWFVLGCMAMFAYCFACVVLATRTRAPVWVAASASWLAWFGTAATIYAICR